MAQSGYTPIQIYYSTTTTNTPTAGNLANGELAINITDGKLFYKDNTGTVQVLATKGGTSGSFTNISATGTITAGSNFIGPGTGLTGTATTLNIGGNAATATLAATVTTNANLTGPITSVGNTTSIASQTGTGSTFVVSTSPSITTPTLTNPTITNYVETLYSATGSTTINLANGTVQKISTSGITTVTLPASVTGKSLTVIVYYSNTGDTITFAGGSLIKWASNTVPTGTSISSKYDIFNFYQDGTYTYGAIYGQNF